MIGLKNYLKNLKRETIICGDFNINWGETSYRMNLRRITDKFDLVQVIQKPKRITSSSNTNIDLIFTSGSQRIVKSYNMLAGFSEDNLILVTRKLSVIL